MSQRGRKSSARLSVVPIIPGARTPAPVELENWEFEPKIPSRKPRLTISKPLRNGCNRPKSAVTGQQPDLDPKGRTYEPARSKKQGQFERCAGNSG
jgi:hypothetical protein